jgi:tetratricopeptide (TPR) repeat protein
MRAIGWAVVLPLMLALPLAPEAAQARCRTSADPQANALAREGDALAPIALDAAIAKYKEALARDPSSHTVHFRIAAIFERKEMWREAEASLAEACKLAPNNARYLAKRGFVLLQLEAARARPDALRDARAALEAAIAKDPALAEAHHDLAEALERMHDDKGALAHETRAIESSPDRGAYWIALGERYLRLGYLDYAERVVRASEPFVRDDRSRFLLAMVLGAALDEKGDNAGAIAAFERAKGLCGACGASGEQIVFFRLGAAYASASPPRRAEASHHLQTFYKLVCKGAAAMRYAEECAAAQEIANRVGGMP